MPKFKVFNGPAPSSAQQLAVTSGTSIKTMLQLATPSTKSIIINAWGITHDGHASCTSASAELIVVEDAATVTAFTTASVNDITRFQPNDYETLMTLGTTGSGYTSSSENTGSISTSDVLDSVYLVPTTADRHIMQWPLGEAPIVAASRFVRIRVTMAGNATNVRCWLEWTE